MMTGTAGANRIISGDEGQSTGSRARQMHHLQGPMYLDATYKIAFMPRACNRLAQIEGLGKQQRYLQQLRS